MGQPAEVVSTERRRFAIDVPLDLATTLAPLGGKVLEDGWWKAMRTPVGPATLHLRRSQAGVEAVAYGEGAGWAVASVPDLIGLHDRPEDFRTDHPLVAELHRRHPGVRIGRTNRVFEALLAAVIAQKVTGKEAGRSHRALRRRFGSPAPGPHAWMSLPPDPARLAVTPYYELHPLGIERRRADLIRRIAAEAPRLERLVGASTEETRAYLERIPGVGPWSSAKTVALSHGDADAVAVGDFHLKHVVSWHLAGEPRGTDERMLALLAPFVPHRLRVLRLLSTLGDEPRYGPRMPLRSIAEI